MRRWLAFLVIVTGVAAPAIVAADEPPLAGLAAHAGEVGKALLGGVTPSARPARSLMFHASSPWLTPGAIADQLDAAAGNRAAVVAQLEGTLTGMAAAIQKNGQEPYDLSIAYAYYIATDWKIATGGAVSARASDALIAQLRGALPATGVARLGDADKQRLWEALLLVASLVSVNQSNVEKGHDADAIAAARRQAGQSLMAAIGVGADGVQIDDSGISARGGAPVAAPSPAPTPAPAAAAPAPGGSLVYTIPAGWTETRMAGAMGLSATPPCPFYGNGKVCQFRMIVLPARPIQGSVEETYKAAWNETIASTFAANIAPLPLRRRVASGLGVAYDGATMPMKTGGNWNVYLYLVYGEREAVPVLAMSDLYDKSFGVTITAFLEHASIPGERASAPIFTKAQLAGDWTTSSVAIASYVNLAGSVVGDASIATGTTLSLRPDGSYKYHAIAIGQGRAAQDDAAGTWSIDDDVLVLNARVGQAMRWRIFGAGTNDKGAVIYMAPITALLAPADFDRPRGSYGQFYGHDR